MFFIYRLTEDTKVNSKFPALKNMLLLLIIIIVLIILSEKSGVQMSTQMLKCIFVEMYSLCIFHGFLSVIITLVLCVVKLSETEQTEVFLFLLFLSI